VRALERRHLDLEAGTLRLDAGATKNDEGRVVYLTSELRGILGAQVERVKELERQAKRIIPVLFPRFRGPRRESRLETFARPGRRRAESLASRGGSATIFGGRLCGTWWNAGVPERVAMKVTGHKTRAVFDRYHIVSPGDLKDVARRLSGESRV